MGIAGMVLGIIGLVLVFIPFIQIISVLLAIIGLPLSIVGMVQGRKNETPTGMAIAGIVLNLIVLSIAIFVVGAILSFFAALL